MLILFVVLALLIVCVCVASILWDTHAIADTRRRCLRGDHEYCTEKSPWHIGEC